MVAPQTFLLSILCSLSMVSANQSAFLNGAHDSVVNSVQQIDKLNAAIREHPEHAGAMTAATFAQATDSQIDNAISIVANALAPLTGGLSVAVGQAVLGPFVQSVTDGAEVFLGNIVGGAFDLAANPQMISNLAKSYNNLVSQANNYHVNTSRLQYIQKQIQQRIPKQEL